MNAGTLLALVAAFALPVAAQTGARGWVVLDIRPGIAVLASEPVRGPQDIRELDTLIILATPVAGLDVEITPWIVDCRAMSVLAKPGVGYLGTEKVRDMPSHTRGVMERVKPGSSNGKIAEYACTGKLESGDDTHFTAVADAIAYGRKIAER